MRGPSHFSQAARRRLYQSGLLGAYHTIRNHQSLTVVMFHRVLAPDDPRWSDVDPVWTMTNALFGACLKFFRKHYHVIDLPDLVHSWDSGSVLPQRALLITFDDGWADIADYALHELQRASLPATVFVIAGTLDGNETWQEVLLRAWRRGALAAEQWHWLWQASTPIAEKPATSRWSSELIHLLIFQLCRLHEARRTQLLEHLRPSLGSPRLAQLLTLAQLRSLRSSGLSIGSHGATHAPIPFAHDAMSELSGSRSLLTEILGDAPAAFSFPHGLYDATGIASALAAGYRLLFTSDPRLSPLNADKSGLPVFGRISIPAHHIADERGRLRPDALATWLFRRETSDARCYAN